MESRRRRLERSDDEAKSVTVQSDGRILVAGRSYTGVNFDFALVRYDSNGSLDTSFDGDGKLTNTIGIGHDEAESVAVQSDGKIVVAGRSTVGTGFDLVNVIAVIRFDSNGSLDISFDGDGKRLPPSERIATGTPWPCKAMAKSSLLVDLPTITTPISQWCVTTALGRLMLHSTAMES